MDKKETAEIMKVIKGAYPNHFKGLSKDDVLGAIDVWSMIYEKYTFDEVSKSLINVIRTNTSSFPPSHGVIIKDIQENKGLPGVTYVKDNLTKGRQPELW